jgi:7SK snRNA methylphosphate capping enzyme
MEKPLLINRKRERDDINKSINKTDLEEKTETAVSVSNIDKAFKEITDSKDFWLTVKLDKFPDILIKDKKYSFGNYNRFYYKKYLEALKDERLGVIKKEWFIGKRCLDIGCNDGTLTLMLAMEYEPKLIEGIDIDYRLIKTAVKNLKYLTRNNLSETYINNLLLAEQSFRKDNNIVEQILNNQEDESVSVQNALVDKVKDKLKESHKMNDILNKLKDMPVSFIMPKTVEKDKLDLLKSDNNNGQGLNNVMFRQENYIAEVKEEVDKYDTIVCLSTAKWIHLNYSDVGIKLMFYNVYRQLKLEGLFIFEFQCWKSYKKRQDLTKRTKENFEKIKLKPEMFKQYLEETYGYECVEITNPPSNAKKKYDRPIYVFKKVK